MATYSNVFSNFEVRETAFKFDGESAFTRDDCVGSLEVQETVRTITKSCRGVVVKNVVKHGGVMELTVSMHMKWTVFLAMFGLDSTGLKAGVYATNRDNSVHKSFVMVNHVYDEDGNEKYIAFPNCVATEGFKISVTNGATEVAEIEAKFQATVDENGNSMYDCMVSELTDTSVATSWMTNFSYDLVEASA